MSQRAFNIQRQLMTNRRPEQGIAQFRQLRGRSENAGTAKSCSTSSFRFSHVLLAPTLATLLGNSADGQGFPWLHDAILAFCDHQRHCLGLISFLLSWGKCRAVQLPALGINHGKGT